MNRGEVRQGWGEGVGVVEGGGAYQAGGGACGVAADVGLPHAFLPMLPAGGSVDQAQAHLVLPGRLQRLCGTEQVGHQVSARRHLRPLLHPPAVLTVPQPVVTQDQPSFSSSSSSGRQTGVTPLAADSRGQRSRVVDQVEDRVVDLALVPSLAE